MTSRFRPPWTRTSLPKDTDVERPENPRKRKPTVNGVEVQEWISSLLHDQDESKLRGLSSHIAQEIMDELWKRLHTRNSTLEDEREMSMLGYKIAVHHEVIPTAFLLKGVKAMEAVGNCHTGGFAEVHEGIYGGLRVALKVLLPPRTHDAAALKGRKIFYRETLIWSTLHHRHILPFLGISESAFLGKRCIVTPWMVNGCVRDYIRSQRSHGRLQGKDYVTTVDKWLYQIACGVEYLHSEGVVHGDLHSGNALIDQAERVLLADFGLSLTAEAIGFSHGSTHGGGAVHFTAPELMIPEDFGLDSRRPTYSSDIYAFACTCIEMYSGKLPFQDINPNSNPQWICIQVCREERPSRPSLPEGGTISNNMWCLIQSCWAHDPSLRPQASDIIAQMQCMSFVSLFFDTSVPPEKLRQALEHIRDYQSSRTGQAAVIPGYLQLEALHSPSQRIVSRGDAQFLIDWIWNLRHTSLVAVHELHRLAWQIASTYEVLPTEFVLVGAECGEDKKTIAVTARASFGNFRGKPIAIKPVQVSRTYNGVDTEVEKSLYRECLLWSGLYHERVLPLLGLAEDISPSTVCIISPRMANGPIISHIQEGLIGGRIRGNAFPAAVIRWMLQIALGLEYLHSENVIHGYLCANNILVDENEDICIAGDLSSAAREGSSSDVDLEWRSTWSRAPELICPVDFGLDLEFGQRPTYRSDVFAFGSVCFELLTGESPFHRFGRGNLRRVQEDIMKQRRPSRPRLPDGRDMLDEVWSLMTSCWAHHPSERPLVTTLVKQLERVNLYQVQSQASGEIEVHDMMSSFRRMYLQVS